MIRKDLRPLINPAGIAIVGASPKPGAGTNVIENLRTLGYTGGIYPVNPGYDEIMGLKCHESLAAIPAGAPLDAVAIVLGYKQVPGVLAQAGERGIKAAWAFASGFAEVGPEGAARQAELARLCSEQGISFCGPNCVGFIDLHHRTGLFSAPLPPGLEPGPVGVIVQSGSVALALVNSNRGLGFSTLVSSGNEAVLDTTDYLAQMIEDQNTGVICAFLEGLRQPEEFARLCGLAAEKQKPLVVLKVGRSELARQTVKTHTGALAGQEAAFEAFFRKHGVIQVSDLDEMMETAELLAKSAGRLPAGKRVGVITVSGGEIGLMGDLSQDLDFSFPPLSRAATEELGRRLPPFSPIGNPLDAWGSGDLAETYPACLEVLAAEDNLDLLLISQDSPPGMADIQVDQYADVARAAVKTARNTQKPVVIFSHLSNGLEPRLRGILAKAGLPLLQGSRESLKAVGHLIQYACFLRQRKDSRAKAAASPANLKELRAGLSQAPEVLDWSLSKELLAGYGIDLCPGGLVGTLAWAKALAAEIGYPVALKVQSSQVLHRTEAGLVKLALADQSQLEVAWLDLEAKLSRAGLTEGIEGFWLQKMAPTGAREMLLGLNNDSQLGPLVVLGLGGVLVELLQDTATALPPFSPDEAGRMISSLKGSRILEGFRGAPPVDVAALEDIVIKLGRLAVDLGDELESLDLNPVMVLPEGQGVWVVDLLIQRRLVSQ